MLGLYLTNNRKFKTTLMQQFLQKFFIWEECEIAVPMNLIIKIVSFFNPRLC